MQYNEEILRNLFANLEKIALASICLCDANGIQVPLTRATPCPLCVRIKEHYMGKCLYMDSKVLEHLTNDYQPYYYTCHFGFIEIAIPVLSGGNFEGYLLIGPFRAADQYENNISVIKQYCDEYGYGHNQALSEYEEIPLFSETKFQALVEFCHVLFEYAEFKHIIMANGNRFNEVIKPYIMAHLSDEITVSDLCDIFHMSKKMLYREFMDNTKMTPKQWLNRQRLYEAQQLITTTKNSLTEIALSVGFKDYNYFIKLFKKQFGKTPSYYR